MYRVCCPTPLFVQVFIVPSDIKSQTVLHCPLNYIINQIVIKQKISLTYCAFRGRALRTQLDLPRPQKHSRKLKSNNCQYSGGLIRLIHSEQRRAMRRRRYMTFKTSINFEFSLRASVAHFLIVTTLFFFNAITVFYPHNHTLSLDLCSSYFEPVSSGQNKTSRYGSW